MKVPVTTRALVQRINRVFIKTGYEFLRKTRGNRWRSDLGDYYLIDENRNMITGKDVDPESLGRELGVLKEYESISDEVYI